MIPIQFDYVRPESLETAVQLLSKNEKAQILAGGHSLLTAIKLGQISPSMLVDLTKIPGLQDVRVHHETDSVLKIGAMSTYNQIANALEIQEKYHALAEAINSIGDAQIRNWGKVGDTFAYSDLACDLAAIFLVLKATFHTITSNGDCKIPADRFIVGSSKAQLRQDEILTSISFPAYVVGSGSAYEHFKHPASSYTLCGVAALVKLANNGTVAKCRVAITGATTSALRLHKVAAALEGKIPTAENIAIASTQAFISEADGDLSDPVNSYASAEYRSDLATVLTERVLARAIKRTGL
jgi:aerobic carbon-monoxide dehydrogenase medium subunit